MNAPASPCDPGRCESRKKGGGFFSVADSTERSPLTRPGVVKAQRRVLGTLGLLHNRYPNGGCCRKGGVCPS